MNDNAVTIKNIFAGYPGKDVLFDLSMQIPAGKITVIIGPNGCSKSTLLKTMCGLLTPASGNILFGDKPLYSYSAQMLARQIAYLPQNRPVLSTSAGHMVLQGRFPYLSYPRHYRAQDHRIAQQAMERMGITELADTPMHTLSGGMRQKVYIAMALAQDTPIVLFDEPNTYLDISHQLQMMEHARYLCREGKTIVMVLHDIPMALKLADQLAVMQKGRLIACQTPEEIWNSGCLDRVFGVCFCRIQTTDGWQYYTVS